ncbi:MAG: FHA domain-containing protein [Pseudomonadales bacterium]|nr:FHA domain-containing protein [Pseudomonadales bacterium]
MALLRNVLSKEAYYLLPHHTFGRRVGAVDSLIEGEDISKLHAVIEWRDEQWWLRDISRNGCWLNEQRLSDPQPLHCGQIIRFGSQPEHQLQVEESDAPRPLLLGMNAQSSTQAISDYHLLPDDVAPQAALFYCPQRQSWVLETLTEANTNDTGSQQRIISHEEILHVGEHCWRLHDSTPELATVDVSTTSPTIDSIHWIFRLSLDEEHVFLQLKHKRKLKKLGERSHHYLLVHLARLHFLHQQEDIDPDNCGWIDMDTLSREIGIDVNHLNIQVFRARKQISEALPPSFQVGSMLQRRRGQLRFLCPQLTIHKGEQIELSSDSCVA